MIDAIGPAAVDSQSNLATLISNLESEGYLPDFVVVPELEVSAISIGVSQSMSLREYVRMGGNLVVASCGSSHERAFLNDLFGWSITPASCASTSKVSNAFNFAGGPRALSNLDAIRCCSTTSLPSEAHIIYASGGAASVWVVPVGRGHVVGLAPDFYDTNSDWNDVVRKCTIQLPGAGVTFDRSCKDCSLGKYSNFSAASHCADCPAGKYQDKPRASSCESCMVNATSPPASTNQSACSCKAGYIDSQGACLPCPAGSFATTTGGTSCTTCPANASSPAASAAWTDCSCKPGFMGNVIAGTVKCTGSCSCEGARHWVTSGSIADGSGE